MAGIYNGYILEFPQIRVDCFTSPPRGLTHFTIPHPYDPSAPSSSKITTYPAPPARLFLLSHVHSDHLLGLSNEFTGKIVCSPDTKRMLLRLEAEKSRGFLVNGTTETISRKYAGLKAKRVGEGRNERIVDMIEALPVGHPKEYDLGTDTAGKPIKVTITLLDANHCPGSTMFLITSPDKAVLHTGDIRCDKLFMQSLKRNPAIQQFIFPISSFAPQQVKSQDGKGKGVVRSGSGRRTLDRIYLDTSAFLGTGDMPDKEEALQDLLDQMSLYPEDTVFFLNVWCFGWEDVIKEVARYFDSPVHIDRYKRSIFSAVQTDPFLSACTTRDSSITRFHACERQAKCDRCRTFNKDGERVWNKDERIVHVTMAEIKSASWTLEREEFVRKLNEAAAAEEGEARWPLNILCPIARHSPLPELQDLVRLFRPHAISPNTLVPQHSGLDYYLLPNFLSDLIQPGAYDRMTLERDHYFADNYGLARLAQFRALSANKAELEAVLNASTGGSERDEFVPEVGGIMGSSRGAQARDQMLRVGGIAAGAWAELQGLGGGGGWSMSGGAVARDADMEGYDTDEEKGRDSKRRRTRESTQESLGDSDFEWSAVERPEVGVKVEAAEEKGWGLVDWSADPKPARAAAGKPSPISSSKTIIPISPSSYGRPHISPSPDIAPLPSPTRVKREREPNAVAGPSKPRPSFSIDEMIIPPFRPDSKSRSGTPARRSPSVKRERTSPAPATARAPPADRPIAPLPPSSIPSSSSKISTNSARQLALSDTITSVKEENPQENKQVKIEKSSGKRETLVLCPAPTVKVERQSTATSQKRPLSATPSGKIQVDRAHLQKLFKEMGGSQGAALGKSK